MPLWVLEHAFCGRYFVGLLRVITVFSVGKMQAIVFEIYIGVTDE
jgi:hypothetical protein